MGTCCEKAARCVNALGFDRPINSQTLAGWNVDFRKHGKFLHPNPNVANGLTSTPDLSEYFPRAEDDVKAFILYHITHFTVVMIQDALNTTIFSDLLEEAHKDNM